MNPLVYLIVTVISIGIGIGSLYVPLSVQAAVVSFFCSLALLMICRALQ